MDVKQLLLLSIFIFLGRSGDAFWFQTNPSYAVAPPSPPPPPPPVNSYAAAPLMLPQPITFPPPPPLPTLAPLPVWQPAPFPAFMQPAAPSYVQPPSGYATAPYATSPNHNPSSSNVRSRQQAKNSRNRN
ncbi:hypothetical protein Ddc_04466 [Ditylenchus destructor]|nr:hypothetical protein Ddc_04466 [Ditylenchus destructor]